jgi:GT2 family glycosyltransferase
VKLIKNETNVGFGRANNQALRQATGNYILLLNPDTIVKEDTFTALLKFFREYTEAGIVSCKVLNPDGTLQLACRRSFPGPWTSLTKVTGLSTLFPKSRLFARYNLTYLDENEVNEVDAISGSFMFLKKEVYDKVGGFDQRFFMYGEDLDFCYRIQSAGYKVYYVPWTEIIHYKGESTKRSSLDETRVFYDAMHLFVKKHFSTFFLVEWILRTAIFFRKIFAFLNIYKQPILSALIDFALITLSVFAAEQIYIGDKWLGFPEMFKPYVYLVPAFVQVIISSIAQNYRRDNLSIVKNLISLFVGMIILSASTFFLKQFAFSRAVLLISYSLLFIILPLWRLIAKTVFRIGLASYSERNNVIVVSQPGTGYKLLDKLKVNITHIYNIKGFVSDKQADVGRDINGYSVVGTLSNLKKLVPELKINKVIFSSHDITFDKMFSIVSDCQGMDVEFLVIGEGQDFLVGKSEVTLFDEIPLLKVNYNISSPWNKVIKYIFDKTAALLLTILVVPFIYIYSLLTGSKGEFISFIRSVPSVLFGDKSFVGPQKDSYIEDLFIGKTGLTGIWFTEASNMNNENDIKRINLYYAKNQNIWLDLEILGKTFAKIFLKTE